MTLPADIDSKKSKASSWFRQLRDGLCAEFEQLEQQVRGPQTDRPPGKFVREHWDHANAAFPNASIVRMVDPVKTLTRPEQQADVAGFFAEHDIPQAAKTLQQVLERQRVNVSLRQRAAPTLAARFGA